MVNHKILIIYAMGLVEFKEGEKKKETEEEGEKETEKKEEEEEEKEMKDEEEKGDPPAGAGAAGGHVPHGVHLVLPVHQIALVRAAQHRKIFFIYIFFVCF